MTEDEIKRAQLGVKTLCGFFEQFGNSVYSQILLEELFKGLIDEEALFVFGQPIQERDQIGDYSSESGSNELQGNGTQVSQPPTDLGEENRPDYP